MTRPVYHLLRIMALIAVTSLMILLITGPFRMSAADEEIPAVILAVAWSMLYLTKPRRTRN